MPRIYICQDQSVFYLVVSLILQNMPSVSIALNHNAVGSPPHRFQPQRITGLAPISVATKIQLLMPPVNRRCNRFLMTPAIHPIRRPKPSSPLNFHPSRFISASESRPRAMISVDLSSIHLRPTHSSISNPLIMVLHANRYLASSRL